MQEALAKILFVLVSKDLLDKKIENVTNYVYLYVVCRENSANSQFFSINKSHILRSGYKLL